MKTSFVLVIGIALLAGAAFFVAPSEASERPNVLFIAIDDLNDWVGVLGGNPQAQTPNLDRLARSGVLFTNAHCAAPACNPSRAALMTGIRPSTSGVYVNPQPWRQSPVLAEAVTLPQHFMAHGYRARGSGKIYHGGYPDPASWEEYWPDQKQNKPSDPKPGVVSVSGLNKGHFDWGPVEAPPEEMGDWKVAEWISGRLSEEQDKPFFLACGFYRPHLPWYAPKEFFRKFPLENVKLPDVPADDLADVPAAGVKIANPEGDHAAVLKHDQWRHAVQAYLANINFVDLCVGKVLDALEAGPNKENTIVVLWSDHGWHLGEKQHWRKFALWEEATQVVMMWRAPGVTQPGGVSNAPVSLLDIYPTLVDLCGLGKNQALEGDSLRALLEDPAAPWKRPALTTHGKDNHALRDQRYRYIRYADGSEELYDHENDEMEWTNLAGDAEYVAVKQRLAKWLPEVNVEPSASEKGKKKKKPASGNTKEKAKEA